jgi:hypothetical protein
MDGDKWEGNYEAKARNFGKGGIMRPKRKGVKRRFTPKPSLDAQKPTSQLPYPHHPSTPTQTRVPSGVSNTERGETCSVRDVTRPRYWPAPLRP